jgi:uncharacterized protein
MLNNSFTHIPSIGVTTERRIWETGIRTMDDFLEMPPEFISLKKRQKLIHHIHASKEKIRSKDARYFYDNLPSGEHWRIFKEYKDSAAYVDIETTGLGEAGDIITTIALYDGKKINYYINGKNLDNFTKDIREYKVIITYNGKTFDIPFIERYFGVRIPHAQLDLRYILYSLGYSGGLKSCERQFGIGRTGGLADVDGFFAVLLWNDYKNTKNEKSLETLLSYNIEDVLNLEYLMIEAYNRKLKDIPFIVENIDISRKPENPFEVDTATVNRIQNQYYSYG